MRGFAILLLFFFSISIAAGDWVRAGLNTNAMVWGRSGGLLFAIPPSGFRRPEPRGLIRLGYPVLSDNAYDLINFIAIEPVVKGRKGFSELERSQLDAKAGKRLSVIPARADANGLETTGKNAGEITMIAPRVEELLVKLEVERFENGAEVILEIRQRSDAPDEISLTTRATSGSADMEFCILTATMGNRTRARQLWLKDEVLTSQELYPEYRDVNFAPHKSFPLDRLLRLENGDAIVAITGDEDNPAASLAFPDRPDHFWNYKGAKVTQYWKKRARSLPAHGIQNENPSVVVNARYVYWGARQPIPHGISFENFELREPFRDGQQVTFGITRKTPQELGFRVRVPPRKQ